MAKKITIKNRKDIICNFKQTALNALKEKKKYNLTGFGIFHIKPARKGKAYGIGKGSDPIYPERVLFKASKDLKRFINNK